jgi:hypothetical protein
MPINRKARFRPGAIHPSLVKPDTGLSVDDITGELSGEILFQEDLNIHERINNLYWKDPVQSVLAFETNDPSDYRIGEAYFSINENNIYIYAGDTPLASQGRSIYQPQSWIDANRTEKFLVISAGIDADVWATKEYVDTELTNLIGGAPDVLNTLSELVNAINNDPNFGATILEDLARLENVKANKDDVYTKDEIDSLEESLLQSIIDATAKFSNVVDYVCGPDVDDDDIDFGNLWLNTKGSITSTTPKNYLIKQNITSPETPPLEIDKGGVHIVGFHPPEKEHKFSELNNVILRVSEPLPGEPAPVISFTNISFRRFFIQADSAACIVIFNNCLFEEEPTYNSFFESQKDGVTLYINNCEFYSNTESVSFSNCNLYINNSDFISSSSSNILTISNSQQSFLLNSKLQGSLTLSFGTSLRVEKAFFKTEQNLSFINVSEDSLLLLQRTTFETPENYTAYYINGTGTAYFDYNIVDISLKPAPQPETRVKQPTASPTLNNGVGADIYHFFDPLGSENFFYNDEKARDAISAMFISSTHSPSVSFISDDANNTLSLNLSLSSSDLSDAGNIAYLNVANVFSQTNTFTSVIANSIDTDTITASISSSAPLMTTNTAPQTVNDTTVATTEYVRTAITELTAQLFTTELNELSDVNITSPELGHVLQYNPSGAVTEKWINGKLSSTNLSDTDDLIRVGDSVFLLDRIEPPSVNRQTGDGGFTGGYTSTNQILIWNGQLEELPSGLPGGGAYVPALSNEIILYATEYNDSTDYNGAGKIWLASAEEVAEGSSNNKAVVPSHLRNNYASVSFDNIPADQKQTARDNLEIYEEYMYRDFSNATDISALLQLLKLPTGSVDGDLLEYSDYFNQFVNVNRVLSYQKYSYIDFTNLTNPAIYTDTLKDNQRFWFAEQSGSYFYNVKTEVNETNYLILPTLTGGYHALDSFPNLYPLGPAPRIGPIVVRKANGSTHENAGTLSLICGSDNDKIMTSDNVIRTNNLGIDYGQAQIDLLHIGHEVVLWPMLQDGDLYWYVEGYYHLSADQQQPDPVVVPTPEAVQDAIENFFNHTYHSSSLSIAYDDANHRLVLTQFFASQDQVNAGLVDDLPIAPNTFKAYIDAVQLTNQITYLTKASNLSDLQDIPAARVNLGLGTAALEDIGFDVNQIPYIGETLTDNYLYYDSTLGGLKSQGLPIATELNFGLSRLATLREVTHNESVNDVVTVSSLHDALTTTNPYTTAIKKITNSLFYVASDLTDIVAVINNYYSLSTNNGSVSIVLPEITDQPLGSLITVKYRLQTSNNETITIAPYTGQTIDGLFQPYILNVEGQSISFILGVDGWEIN